MNVVLPCGKKTVIQSLVLVEWNPALYVSKSSLCTSLGGNRSFPRFKHTFAEICSKHKGEVAELWSRVSKKNDSS